MKPKKVVLLFGEMGSGKSYLGQQVATAQELLFVEGDKFLPGRMRERARNFKPFTAEMLDSLVTILQIQAVSLAQSAKNGIVLSQALYRNEHREALIAFWKETGLEVEAYWVKTGFFQNLRQLWSRPQGLRWVIYWLMNKPWFQIPRHEHNIFENAR